MTLDQQGSAVCILYHGREIEKTYTIAFTPLQYRSHILRNLGCPPMSHNYNTRFLPGNKKLSIQDIKVNHKPEHTKL